MPNISTDPKQIETLLTRAVDTIYPSADALREALTSGRRLRIYLGVDPTGAHLHLGHAVQLLKLKQLQELGHEIIFLIGDFTGRIGDPSDKEAARQPLSEKEIRENMRTFKAQTSKVISFGGKNKAKVKFNSKWLSKLNFADLIRLAQHVTVQQLIERDMFKKRLNEEKPIHLHEFLYPLMQGYDSVAMNVDIEVGGRDQTFNMLMGRTLMKVFHEKEKFVITTKLLEDLKTGKKLMTKSEGGLVNLDDDPNNMFGKVMALGDDSVALISECATTLPMNRVRELTKGAAGDGAERRDAKLALAYEVIKLYHDTSAAERARDEFVRVFSGGETPEAMEEITVNQNLINAVDLLAAAGVEGKNEARRLIEQGGVRLNDKVLDDPSAEVSVKNADVLNVGKKRFYKIRVL